MANRIKNKLRSQTGASITFALLIFLVCTVLCSVILTAATTASGRMARMAEADQRYYSVTSAVKLLKDLFKDKIVTVEREIVTETINSYNNGVLSSGTPVTKSDTTVFKLKDSGIERKYGTISSVYSDPPSESISTTIENAEGALKPEINCSFLTDAALKLVVTSAVSNTTDGYYSSERLRNPIRNIILDIPGKDAASALITETISYNDGVGLVKFVVCNANTNAAERYQLTLSMEADIVENSSSRSIDGAPYGIAPDGSSYTYKTTTTNTTTSILTWRAASVE